MESEGESARGIFNTRAQGRNFRVGRRKPDALERFAELLSEHTDEADLAAGYNLASGGPLNANRLDPGGNAGRSAQRMGLKAQSGNGMLQRIRKRLGRQAR